MQAAPGMSGDFAHLFAAAYPASVQLQMLSAAHPWIATRNSQLFATDFGASRCSLELGG